MTPRILVDADACPVKDEIYRVAWRYGVAVTVVSNSRLRVHGWPEHGGSDMIDLLHARLAEAGIDVVTETRLTDIIADADGQVLGVEVARSDGQIERVGCDALILATGGFAANEAMVEAHMPGAAGARLNAHEGSRGDGIRLGQALGAAVGDMGSYQGYAMLTDPHGISVPPSAILEGGVLVNMLGQRFVDESADIAGMVHPVLAQPGGHCWVVYDARIEAAIAHIPETRALNELNAAKTARLKAVLRYPPRLPVRTSPT
jgi:fumarate reductase flavoprotein subunit